MTAPVSLYVDGQEYSGWKAVRITRGLTRATSDFDLTVSERWSVDDLPWQILPGSACEIRYGNAVMLTGWVDAYSPNYDATMHNVRVSGRSKTCDFVDCSVLVDGGQFRGLTVGQIAQQLAEPFGIEVVIDQDGEPEAEVQVQQGETCFALVERLSRLSALTITDDADGRLVFTRAGSGRATDDIRHGENILAAQANLDHSKRYSEVLVKAQRPGNSNRSNDDAPAGSQWDDLYEPAAYLQALSRLNAIANVGQRYRARMQLQSTSGAKRGNPKSLTQVHGGAVDPGVTRYRPLLIQAETQSDDATAEQRADWEVRRRIAEGTTAVVTLNGWKQRGGDFWAPNLLVQVESRWLALSREMIVSEITFNYDDGGERSSIELTLPDAFLPDPARKAKGDSGQLSRTQRAGKKTGKEKPNPWDDLYAPAP